MFFGYKAKVYVGVSNFHQMQRKKKEKLKLSMSNNFLSSKKCAQLVFSSKLHIKYIYLSLVILII